MDKQCHVAQTLNLHTTSCDRALSFIVKYQVKLTFNDTDTSGILLRLSAWLAALNAVFLNP